MKLSKSLIATLVTSAVLAFGIGSFASVSQTADAASNFDIPIGTVTKLPGTIRVWSSHHEHLVHLFNFEGNDPVISTTRSVQNGTSWYTDEYKTGPNENGVTTKYYRVSTNEWISGWDVNESHFQTGNY